MSLGDLQALPGGQQDLTTVVVHRQRPSYGVDKGAMSSTLCHMDNFIAKRHVYIDDTIVWVHKVTDVINGPNYMNATKLPTNAASETDFAYLSGDGDPEQKFVSAQP